MRKNITIIIITILLISFIAITAVSFTMLIRNNNINNQILNSINTEYKIATVFCNGRNFKINDEVYNKLKEFQIDLIITNEKYIAKINNINITNRIDIEVDIDKYSNYDEAFLIKLNNNVSELKINISNNMTSKEYVSEFVLDNGREVFVVNNIKVQDDNFAELSIKDGITDYIIAYVVPESINAESFTINKGNSENINLGIEPNKFTIDSINIGCDNKDAIEINGFNIVAKQVGEYKLYIESSKFTKEVSLKVVQPAEKIVLNKNILEMLVGTLANIEATVIPNDAVNKELVWTSNDNNIATVDNNGNIKAIAKGNCQITVATVSQPIIEVKIQIAVNEKNKPVENMTSNNVEDITYINGIMLVNKNHPIPSSYAPGLLTEVYNAFLELKRDAANAGHNIELLSGFRSYETQKRLYNNYVATYGQAEADTFSARPGTSEHQTGLAMDVGWIDDSYGDTPSGKWLAENCYKYGFIIRYMKGKESITGYKYEPWHIRYLGKDIAKDVYYSGLCLEEYLGVN